MDESSIEVSLNKDTAFIRVHGRGTFQNARHVKTFLQKATDQGATTFIFDMKECTHMDSTFMGMLAGLSIQQKKKQRPLPQLQHLSAKNLDLLENLGLNRVLNISQPPTTSTTPTLSPIAPTPQDKQAISQTMLDAHEALVQIDPANRIKFQDVIQYLKDETNTN